MGGVCPLQPNDEPFGIPRCGAPANKVSLTNDRRYAALNEGSTGYIAGQISPTCFGDRGIDQFS